MEDRVSKDEEDSDRAQHYQADRFPLPTTSSPRLSSSSGSSLDRGPDLFAHVHPPTPPDMDARRRKALLMKHANGSIADTLQARSRTQRQRRKGVKGANGLSGRNHMADSSSDGHSSDFSSRTMSDDVEMNSISSEVEFTDDEEAGLTKKDAGRRKRRRRKNTLLNERVTGAPGISKPAQHSADQNLVKALVINTLLIASWYTFSLSISIVSLQLYLGIWTAADCKQSTINGCLTQSILISISLCSRPVRTCLYNSPWPASFFTWCHISVGGQTVS